MENCFLFIYSFIYLFIHSFILTIIPQFSNKSSKSDRIILNEDGKSVSDEKELCRTFNTYFAIIVSDIKIPNIQEDAPNIRSNHDPVLAAIITFRNQPSIVKGTLTQI